MPYITHARRDSLNKDPIPTDAGELNYLFTDIARRYVSYMGGRYQHYNDVIGALEACKLELYRRAVAPYEDKKIKENGDVYP